MMAAQREAIQPLDQLRAVAPLLGEREALAEAAEALRHLGRVEGFGSVEEGLERLPLLRMQGLERRLPHWRPAK
jgi:hypothetical protein